MDPKTTIAPPGLQGRRGRPTVRSTGGMVASSHPRAVRAGLDALAAGGTSADAAVAAAAVLSVVDPPSTGIGGDAFALVWAPGAHRPEALGAAGVAPAGLDVDALRSHGFDRMPDSGPWSVTVPGAVAGWEALLERHGRLGLDRTLQPAIDAAEGGFELTPVVARSWADGGPRLDRAAGEMFLPLGHPPHAGDRMSNPALGRVLRVIADQGAAGFYRGEVAEMIERAVRDAGGPLRSDDLASWPGPAWTEPLGRASGDVTVFEHPPPGQGIVVLMARALYERLAPEDTVGEEHAAIESIKLAFADAWAYVADPAHEVVPTAALLSDAYLSSRRRLIRPDAVLEAQPGDPGGGTVYVAAVDAEGGGCSLIQSVYERFGSGIGVPGAGFVLHNRGAGFVLDDTHPDRPVPGKRPYHTIIPAMLGRGGRLAGCLGVVGGLMQPQGQFQLLRNLLDRGMEAQAAVERPRFRFYSKRTVRFETGFDSGVVEALGGLGHDVGTLPWTEAGGAQVIVRDGDAWAGGSDPRKDGLAAGLAG